MHTEHIKYELIDYITGHLSEQERLKVESHLQLCLICKSSYLDLLSTNNILKNYYPEEPNKLYYSTILPRVYERINSQFIKLWNYRNISLRIIIPLTVSILLLTFLIKMPTDKISKSTLSDVIQEAIGEYGIDEVTKSIREEYSSSIIIPGIQETEYADTVYLSGEAFRRESMMKLTDFYGDLYIDLESINSDYNNEEVDQLLSRLAMRNML